MRLVRYFGFPVAALLLLSIMISNPVSHAAGACTQGTYHFWSLVTQGAETGTVVEGILAVTGPVAPTLTFGNGTVVNVGCSATSTSIALQASLGKAGALAGRGTMTGKDWFGTFTGPRAGDGGAWRAVFAPTSIALNVAGAVVEGPHKGMNVVGDVNGIVEPDGTLFGTYLDSSNVGAGLPAGLTFPVHGWYVNGNLSVAIQWTHATDAFMTFHAVKGRFYGPLTLTGTLAGPGAGDTGSVAAMATNNA